MKRFSDSLVRFIKKPVLAIVLIILGTAMITGYFLYQNSNMSYIDSSFYSPKASAVCADGRIAVIDSESVVYCFNPEDMSVNFILNPDNINKENYLDIKFDEAGNLYLRSAMLDEDTAFYKSERIVKYDANGNYVREVCSYNYENPYGYDNIYAMNVSGDSIRYIYYSFGDDKAELIAVDSNSSSHTVEAVCELGENGGITAAAPCENGDYAVIAANDDAVIITGDGEYSIISSPYFSLGDYDDSILYSDIAEAGGEIYIIGGLNSECIYNLDEEGIPYECFNIFDFIEYDEEEIADGEETGEEELYDYYVDYPFNGIYDMGGNLGLSIGGYIYVIHDDGSSDEYGDELKIPFIYSFMRAVFGDILYAGIAVLAVGIILAIGCLMRWHFSILSKILLLTLPVVLSMAGFIVASMVNNIRKTYFDGVEKEMTAASQLAVKMIDGDVLNEIDGFESYDNGVINELSGLLRSVFDERNGWSDNIEADIYLVYDRNVWLSAANNSPYTKPPFLMKFYTSDDLGEEAHYSGCTETLIDRASSETSEFMTATTPIYDSEGNVSANLQLCSYMSELEEEVRGIIRENVLKASLFVVVLVILLSIISYSIVRNLKKAKDVVSDIADGNFSTRVKRISGDEIGDICTGVNNMAGQLETLFDEKDKSEQFYYKFVPEKFRELLHKENFTDLSLGDAESADLTVLFCDIRAFSLNSEMMTAKENFEFVNVIYGKAGPIIREHGGFIDKYIGDAVMALFEDADKAVDAGIALYREIVLNPKTAEELNISSINIGIGIHSGMATIGIVGEDERMSGTVISNTVNLSSRLEGLTKQYSTAMIISKDTLDRMKNADSLNTRYLGMVQVAGVNEVKALYEVLDCLDDERKHIREATKSAFREAIRLFHLGNLNDAVELLEKTDRVSGGADPVLGKYISYINEKLEKNDLEHNVFRFSRK